MSKAARQRIIGVLAYHVGGWIDNGDPNKCHCNCGYKGQLGEFHGAHVADAIIAALGLTYDGDAGAYTTRSVIH